MVWMSFGVHVEANTIHRIHKHLHAALNSQWGKKILGKGWAITLLIVLRIITSYTLTTDQNRCSPNQLKWSTLQYTHLKLQNLFQSTYGMGRGSDKRRKYFSDRFEDLAITFYSGWYKWIIGYVTIVVAIIRCQVIFKMQVPCMTIWLILGDTKICAMSYSQLEKELLESW